MRNLRAIIALLLLPLPAIAGSLQHYVDPRQQTAIPFGSTSQWAQPWRAYLETKPASVFLDGTGINYTDVGNPDIRIRHLAHYGITHLRVEIGWSSVSYDDETKLSNAASLRPILEACVRYHIRPLIVLNANQGVPCPAQLFSRKVTVAAHAGDREVTLDSTAGLIVGHSGLSNLTDYWAAEALITAINGQTITLSKALPKDIAAGTTVSMATLKYRPFSPPGSPDEQATLTGWMRYVDTVSQFVRNAMGTQNSANAGFDLEIWNELSFGSAFLSINNYYNPPLAKYHDTDIWAGLVRETAVHVEANRAAFRGVLIGDGFANTIPWTASSQEPVGVTAIDKHPYHGRSTFPDPKAKGQPINALLQPDTTVWQPTYTALFPEYLATVLQTETVIREMSPLTTEIYGTAHGRYARTPPVTTWITEVGMAPQEDLAHVDAVTAEYLKAKTTARYFTFFLNKGVTLMTLFNDASGGDTGLGLESQQFLDMSKQPGAVYPADDRTLTSPALQVVGRIAAQMRPGLDLALTPTTTQALTLDAISDTHDHAQFAGDGTPAHPPLYDRDVFAFLPFQVNAHKFVIPYYVMTRDVNHVYNTKATGGHQYDMPSEDFTLTIGGLNGKRASVTGYDPLNDRRVAVKRLSGTAQALTVRVPTVDYPYLLIVEER